jgi:hypothetical protein
VLARRYELPASKVETISPRSHVQHFGLASVADVDAELTEWVGEAYAVGEQRRIEKRTPPNWRPES